MSHKPIGIFDSGFGGLTVMRAIRALLPHENIVYFGDTARLPYGNKSPETIIRYSLENADFLLKKEIKVLVIACNTACSVALDAVQKALPIPVIGIISPGVEKVIEETRSKKIGVLGTRATIASGVHREQILSRLPEADVTDIACPLFVPFVEEGLIEHPAIDLIVEDYIRALQQKQVDTVLLGCTHYPLLDQLLQKKLGQGVKIIDPSLKCAETVRDVLIAHKLQNHNEKLSDYQFFVSDDPEKFRLIGRQFLGVPIDKVSKPY